MTAKGRYQTREELEEAVVGMRTETPLGLRQIAEIARVSIPTVEKILRRKIGAR